jgi:hypothetical protein
MKRIAPARIGQHMPAEPVLRQDVHEQQRTSAGPFQYAHAKHVLFLKMSHARSTRQGRSHIAFRQQAVDPKLCNRRGRREVRTQRCCRGTPIIRHSQTFDEVKRQVASESQAFRSCKEAILIQALHGKRTDVISMVKLRDINR